MRRFLAVLSSAALALGMLLGVTTPASAANVGTITFTAGTPTVSPSVVSGQVGDTFTINVSGTTAVIVDGSAVSAAGSACSPTVCTVTSASPVVFTINSAGNVVLEDSNNLGSTATLTIQISSGSSTPRPPEETYPTMFLNANGGTCSGPMLFVKSVGPPLQSLPTQAQCSRTGYTLGGWARSADATTSEFAAGWFVPIGNESFTLYAVWEPTGSLITYDANIGANDACINAAGVNVPVGDGRISADLNPANLATTAPCSPDSDQLELTGWATSGDGSVAYELGAPVPFAAGTQQRLYAVWQVKGTERSIEIAGEVVDVVSNSSLVRLRVTGVTTGFEEGDVVVPWRGAPGEEPFAESIQLPRVQADGTFTWQRRTGRGITEIVYFTSQDGSVRSNSITFQEAPDEPTIFIEGERGDARTVVVKGTAAGISEGEVVVPRLRSPGQTGYSVGTARPTVQADGSFTWQRRTGKTVAVYFTSEDGSVRSNLVILPAR